VVRKRFREGGAELIPMTPQQVTSYLKEEQVKWRQVVKEQHITTTGRR